MKLWHSFVKELTLSARGFYFYVELAVALISVLVILFAVPEQFSGKQTEYIYLNLPVEAKAYYEAELLQADLDGQAASLELPSGSEKFPAELYETATRKIYLLQSEAALVQATDTERPLVGAVIEQNAAGEAHYRYYLQGYETARLRNIYLLTHIQPGTALKDAAEQQEVVALSTSYDQLTDRENTLPAFLVLNGGLMSMFIIAAYIFLDKQEGIVKAYAVTASSIWNYLLSKVGVVLVTSIVSALILIVPVMGLQPNYLLLLLLLIGTGVFSSGLGLLVASFYRNIMQAFGALFALMLATMLPTVAYFIPSWSPAWVKLIPSYAMIQAAREIILPNGDGGYVLLVSGLLLAAGLLLLLLAKGRHQRSLAA